MRDVSSWTAKGEYEIIAKSKDIHGAESEWGELEVTMPRDKVIYSSFMQFLQSRLNMFPMLQRLLQQLGL